MNFQLIVLFLLIFNFSHLDVAENWISTSQDPAIPVMEGIINFHNHIMTFLTVIVVFVAWFAFRAIVLFEEKAKPL